MSEQPKVILLTLDKIKADPGVSARETLPPETIADYAARMREGAEFGPVIVCFDDGGTVWLADGFLRHAAALQAGVKALWAEVRPGGMRAARLHAAGANSRHGLPRTPADKRLAVLRVLELAPTDGNGKPWSITAIAAHCDVGTALVKGLKALAAMKPEAPPAELAARGVLAGPGGRNMPQTSATVYEPQAKPKPGPVAEPAKPEATPMLSLADALKPPKIEPAAEVEDDDDDDQQEDSDLEPTPEERADALEDRERTEERLRRALRKAERFAQTLGMTLPEAVEWHARERGDDFLGRSPGG